MMIRSRVSVLEEAMEIDPPVTDLSGDDDSMDSEYADVDDGGAMLVDDTGGRGGVTWQAHCGFVQSF